MGGNIAILAIYYLLGILIYNIEHLRIRRIRMEGHTLRRSEEFGNHLHTH
jgi:hypothetical protein